MQLDFACDMKREKHNKLSRWNMMTEGEGALPAAGKCSADANNMLRLIMHRIIGLTGYIGPLTLTALSLYVH